MTGACSNRCGTGHHLCDLMNARSGPGAVGQLTQVKKLAVENWKQFWSTGGAIDLSGSKDARWFELERRIVLSQYLVAIQDAGKNPPQETGLTYNTWEGKFHLEMHWWHEAQFALWNRRRCWRRVNGMRIIHRSQRRSGCYRAPAWTRTR